MRLSQGNDASGWPTAYAKKAIAASSIPAAMIHDLFFVIKNAPVLRGISCSGLSGILPQVGFHALHDHIQRHKIFAALGHDDVREALAGFDKLLMHGLYGG